MRLKSFLIGSINLAISISLLFLNYSIVRSIPPETSEGRLGLIVVLPLLIITAILNFSTIITTLISSCISIGSERNAIKIISIFILISGIACLGTFAYLAYKTIIIL